MICLQKPESKTEKKFAAEINAVLQEYNYEFSAIRYAVVDADVVAAKPLVIINTAHPKDAIISVWRENMLGLEHFFAAIQALGTNYQQYAVMEIRPINIEQLPGRVEGMCQIAFLQKPPRLDHQQWLDIWLKSHTKVAIDTQSTFSYRQNIVVLADALIDATVASDVERLWPICDAIVEENFPDAAMTDRAAFFNSASDEKRYKENERRMIESCMQFIDFNRFDCVPMSEYIIK